MNLLASRLQLSATAVFGGFTAITVLLFLFGLGASPSARAASGLFGSVTPITESPPVANDRLGEAFNGGTALSEDGETALVTDPDATVSTTAGAGKAYIYHYANGQWTLTAELDDPDAAAGNADNFGTQSALNADGTVAIVGSNLAAVNGQAGAGKAYVYTLSNGSWTLSHEFDDPAAAANDGFGFSVGLSGAGSAVVIGAWNTTVAGNANAGEAYIYGESNGAWSQTAAIPDPDNAANDQFGAVVAMSLDGSSVLVGSEAAVNGQTYAGKAHLYTLSNGSWTLSHEFDDPAATANDTFGWNAVSLSSHGQSAAISSCGTSVNGQVGAGVVYMFHESNGAWTQTAAIADPDDTAYDYFCFPAQISANGTSVLVGSEATVNGQAYAGKAHLYTLSNGSWTLSHEFDDPAATANDYFGYDGAAISGDGEAAFMSAGGTTVNSVSSAGEAYIYQSLDDLSLTLSAMPSSVHTGNNVAFDATVTNTDTTVTAYNVTLTDTLPAGLTYASSTSAGGSCSASSQTVTCTLASLAPNATWQPTVSATATMTGSLSDTANVSSNEPDPATSNNSAAATVTVKSPPSSGGGGVSSPFSLGLLAALLVLGGLRRRALHRDT